MDRIFKICKICKFLENRLGNPVQAFVLGQLATDNRTMIYQCYVPAPPLASYIDDFYYWSGPASYKRQKVLPTPSLNVMINLGCPFQVYKPEQAQLFSTCTASWLVGVWNRCHIVDWPPNVRFYGIHFKPSGAYPFLQFPLSELNAQIAPLDAIWGLHALEIRERLDAAPAIQAGFDLLERLLLARLHEPPQGFKVVQYAIAEIAQQQGTLSIQGLSDHIGISQNHLGTQFKRFVGVSPKEFSRFYRFAHILREVDSTHPIDTIDWTTIAHQSGFYDQSHFNKEFAAFTGHSPTDYLRLRRRVCAENLEQAQVCHNLPID